MKEDRKIRKMLFPCVLIWLVMCFLDYMCCIAKIKAHSPSKDKDDDEAQYFLF